MYNIVQYSIVVRTETIYSGTWTAEGRRRPKSGMRRKRKRMRRKRRHKMRRRKRRTPTWKRG